MTNLQKILCSVLVFGALIFFFYELAHASTRTTKEIMYMSRQCDNGWYLDSQDGDKVVMACMEPDDK